MKKKKKQNLVGEGMFFWFGLERTGFRRIYIDSNKPEWFFFYFTEKETTEKSTESEREKKGENHGKTWN